MELEIEQITGKSSLKKFIKFPMELYKGNPAYVPPIIDFELSTLLPEKNPAFEHAKASFWVIKKGGKIVGRTAAIALDAEISEKQLGRFGWIDFIDDRAVSRLLLDTVRDWLVTQGAKAMHGPMGFTDFDFEGALVSGFDHMATQATIYNAPYYIDHYEAYGLKKSVDWIEMRGWVPDELPRRLTRSASIISKRFNIYPKKFNNRKSILPYARGVFDILNKSYRDLYGFVQLTPRQIDYFVEQYFGFVDKDFVSIIVNENDKVVAAAISLPSLSRAFQKAKGHLFPFGFIHVLKALRSKDHIDMLLIGVDPDYQKLGANVLIFNEMFESYKRKKVKYACSGPVLEDNLAALNLWNDFGECMDDVDIRRRCFIYNFQS